MFSPEDHEGRLGLKPAFVSSLNAALQGPLFLGGVVGQCDSTIRRRFAENTPRLSTPRRPRPRPRADHGTRNATAQALRRPRPRNATASQAATTAGATVEERRLQRRVRRTLSYRALAPAARRP